MPPSAEQMKDYCWQYLDSIGGYLGRISDAIFSYGELGMQEKNTCALLSRELERHGFAIQRNLAGMPTAFSATYGEGRPFLAMTSEYDATPNTSQYPGVAEPKHIVPGAPGHSEGHNNNGAAMLGTALAVAQAIKHFGLGGRIMAIGAPAEEELVSRPFIVRAGVLNGVDAAIGGHIQDTFSTIYGLRQYALISIRFRFEGRASHPATHPWAGISALDAMQLMNVGWEMLREHLPIEHRSHHVTVEGGDQPNVVPARATTWYYFRERDPERAQALLDRARQVAKGACLMTGASVAEEFMSAVWPSRENRVLCELHQANIEKVGVPKWTEEEEELAKAVQLKAGLPPKGLVHEVTPLRQAVQNPSSSDLGDITWVVPHGRLYFPTQPIGVNYHHWSGGVTIGTSIAHKGLLAGAKALAGTALDLLASSRLVAEVRKTFQEEIGDIKYRSLIPTDVEPPLDLHHETMERYRSRMEPLYYDPESPQDYLSFLRSKTQKSA